MEKVILPSLILTNHCENSPQRKINRVKWVSTKNCWSWLKRISKKRKWEALWALAPLHTLQVACLVGALAGRAGERAQRWKSRSVLFPNHKHKVGIRIWRQVPRQEVSILLRCHHKVPHTKIAIKDRVMTLLSIIIDLGRACSHLQAELCTSRSPKK